MKPDPFTTTHDSNASNEAKQEIKDVDINHYKDQESHHFMVPVTRSINTEVTLSYLFSAHYL